MIVRLLAAGKNLVHDNCVAKCDVTVRQTPHGIQSTWNTQVYLISQNPDSLRE